ncbi:MAG TPA: SUMF1/EgtB/PvdO family nonheme iron enzyme [Anaerolineaceae bacterium]|nr:SUMF1/EgtB/PvdO family nonheme iron enzyme [Anaerolineaceae bacterium]
MKKLFLSLFILCLVLSACQEVDFNSTPPVFDTGVDPNSWVSIPAGDFLQGQFKEVMPLDHSYEIMVTDVTNAQYAEYLNAALADDSVTISDNEARGYYPGDQFSSGRHEVEITSGDYIYIPVKDDFLRLEYDGTIFTPIPEWSNHPMTMVSWFGAKGYCEYYGWRLPTELEWEKAARGIDGRAFPWGDELERNNANYLSSRDPFENMASFGSRTTPVGFYNGSTYAGYQTLLSTSPYGLYDMAGNVWQWTANIYPKQHYRYMRGGNKDSYENNLRVWVRNNATPTFTSPAVGFRCVRDGD